MGSERLLCQTSHINPKMHECGDLPKDDTAGSDCSLDAECARTDGSIGKCRCKQWWPGVGVNGFCELHVADLEKPSFMEFRVMQVERCHHDWSDQRCAAELGETELMKKVLEERQPTADPTQIDSCAYDILAYYKARAPALRVRISLVLAAFVCWLSAT